jgi:hypothetical protein
MKSRAWPHVLVIHASEPITGQHVEQAAIRQEPASAPK